MVREKTVDTARFPDTTPLTPNVPERNVEIGWIAVAQLSDGFIAGDGILFGSKTKTVQHP